jgi:hypothetical protein
MTDKLQRECIEAASNTNSTHTAYPIHDATYGYVCRDRETEGVLTLWLRDQVGPCIEKKKTEEDTDDLAEDNSPCFSGMLFSFLDPAWLDEIVLTREYSFRLL